jgi:uncharacterized protein (DUF2235 family)
MKRLVVCCDGTWQQLSSPYPTNIERIAQATVNQAADRATQLIYYHEGIGTWDKLDRYLGGCFGIGIDAHILQAYVFLALNYEKGDEIYLIGFSRGAYTVRSLAGMLFRCGLVREVSLRKVPSAYQLYRLPEQLTPDQADQLKQFRADHSFPIDVEFLGCFDTVGSLGVPSVVPVPGLDSLLNGRLRFHNTKISSIVRHAAHACAIDERRKPFDLTPMLQNGSPGTIDQMWFIGDHGCVGGGGDLLECNLSNIPLQWMVERAAESGLEMDFSAQPETEAIDPLIGFNQDIPPIYHVLGEIDREIDTAQDRIHESVYNRLEGDKRYRPKSLVSALSPAFSLA